jgi:hypothetical protein
MYRPGEVAMNANVDADSVATLEELNRAIAELEQRRDARAIERLDTLISPKLVFRRANGSVVRKAEFMAGLNGPSPFVSRSSDDISVAIVGSRALVTLVVAATKPDGSTARYRNVRMWDQREDGWSLEVWFNEELASLASPGPK